jgi:hypothetical protein
MVFNKFNLKWRATLLNSPGWEQVTSGNFVTSLENNHFFCSVPSLEKSLHQLGLKTWHSSFMKEIRTSEEICFATGHFSNMATHTVTISEWIYSSSYAYFTVNHPSPFLSYRIYSHLIGLQCPEYVLEKFWSTVITHCRKSPADSLFWFSSHQWTLT